MKRLGWAQVGHTVRLVGDPSHPQSRGVSRHNRHLIGREGVVVEVPSHGEYANVDFGDGLKRGFGQHVLEPVEVEE